MLSIFYRKERERERKNEIYLHIFRFNPIAFVLSKTFHSDIYHRYLTTGPGELSLNCRLSKLHDSHICALISNVTCFAYRWSRSLFVLCLTLVSFARITRSYRTMGYTVSRAIRSSVCMGMQTGTSVAVCLWWEDGLSVGVVSQEKD